MSVQCMECNDTGEITRTTSGLGVMVHERCAKCDSQDEQGADTHARTSTHRIQWWVYAWNGDGEVHKMRRSRTMRGQWSYDVTCSCGWETRTGGAVRSYIEREVRIHKIIGSES